MPSSSVSIKPKFLAQPRKIVSPEWLTGGGQMGGLIRNFDWSKTPIGPRKSWSPALRMMTRFVLSNRSPNLLWWGPEFIQLYNDAYIPVLGVKHPRLALGQPFRECWSEVYDLLGPLAQAPFKGGEATWMEDILCEINRFGFTEETHFTIAYSPVYDDTVPGGIGGVLATVHEISAKVVAERRVAILRDLGARSSGAKTVEESCRICADVLSAHPKDVPFALFYLMDKTGQQASLAASCGTGAGQQISAEHWNLNQAMNSQSLQIQSDLSSKFSRVPPGPWSDAPDKATIMPIGLSKAHQPLGFLVVGLSPRLRFDEQYRSFLELMAGQISAAINSAGAYERERERARELAELDRAKTVFFSNVSHEFRTPLTLLLGPAEEALAQLTDERQHQNLKIIHRNALRLQKLVNTLLDFSRIESGRIDICYEPTALASYTMELASVFRSAVERAGMKLIVDCEALSEPAYVDRDMWEKIVLNLLSNAFKFTLQGTIHVQLCQERDHVEFSVKDTGIGISEAQLPKIFERFYRVEGARGRTHEGSGIGLAMVQELVKLHGGKITVLSHEGHGTAFTVSLPMGCAHLPAERVRGRRQLTSTVLGARPFIEEALRWLPQIHDSSEQISLPGPNDVHKGSRERILLADDNSDMRNYILRLLAPHYDVEAVSNGEEALSLLKTSRFDLMVSDIMMPGLDGIGLLKEIRRTAKLTMTPVMLLSARAGEESRIEGMEAGADDYITKPFSARELLVRIRARLEIARLRK